MTKPPTQLWLAKHVFECLPFVLSIGLRAFGLQDRYPYCPPLTRKQGRRLIKNCWGLLGIAQGCLGLLTFAHVCSRLAHAEWRSFYVLRLPFGVLDVPFWSTFHTAHACSRLLTVWFQAYMYALFFFLRFPAIRNIRNSSELQQQLFWTFLLYIANWMPHLCMCLICIYIQLCTQDQSINPAVKTGFHKPNKACPLRNTRKSSSSACRQSNVEGALPGDTVDGQKSCTMVPEPFLKRYVPEGSFGDVWFG